MRIAVTRPLEDSRDLAERLHALGHEAVSEPLLRIVFSEGVCVPRRDYQAVLVTSANAVRGLEAAGLVPQLQNLPVLTVGASSADAARRAGFDDVRSADGDLAALQALVLRFLKDKSRPLFYAAGATVSGDLKGLLEAEGFQVERCVLYKAEPATAFSPEFENLLAAGELGGVTLLSPRTARIWSELIVAADMQASARAVVHFCLSGAVAEAVCRGLGEPHPPIRIAARPEMQSLLALLESD